MKKPIFNKLRNIASAVCLGILLAPPEILSGAAALVYGVFMLLLILLVCRFSAIEPSSAKDAVWFDCVFLFLFAQNFVVRWTPSSKAKLLAGLIGIPEWALLLAAAAGLAAFSWFALRTIRGVLLGLLKRACGNSPFGQKLLQLLQIVWMILLQLLCLDFSVSDSLGSALQRSPLAILAAFVILSAVNVLVVLLVQKWRISLSIVSILLCLWAVANYYTIQFHGSPLFLSEFSNARTAAAVISQYSFHLSPQIVCILLLLAAELCFLHFRADTLDLPAGRGKKLLLRFAALAFCAASVIPSYKLAVKQIRPWMPWEVAVEENGFLLCTARDAVQRADPVYRPYGYSTAELPAPQELSTGDTRAYPDILLILNESFCDLEAIAELCPDHDLLQGYYNVEGAAYGWAVAPNVGGGTNNTEYELLTSKSMFLLKAMAPFTYLDQEVLSRSSVRFLQDLGYSTVGLHCEQAKNYSRDLAYPAMGFQSVALGPESFAHKGSNGNRKWLDEDNYADMLDWYEQLGDAPRFVYLLTFQNHGGYEQNDASLDTVHVGSDFGKLTDDLNEYLSSVELSGAAFQELIASFAASDRNVIVCMVGDHAPSFVSELPLRGPLSLEESEIAKRTVPYVIWANFPMELPAQGSYISTVDLLPVLMNAAGIPMPPFYQCVLRLHEEIPVRTSSGLYRAQDGTYAYFSLDDPQNDLLKQYYYMEYNSLLEGDEYRRDLFECK